MTKTQKRNILSASQKAHETKGNPSVQKSTLIKKKKAYGVCMLKSLGVCHAQECGLGFVELHK